MTKDKRLSFIRELNVLLSNSNYYIDWEDIRTNILNGNSGLRVRIAIKPKNSNEVIKRNTTNIDGPWFSDFSGRTTVIVINLTLKEKDLICNTICQIAKRVGLPKPRLAKRQTTKDILSYNIR